ncbi:MAG: citrate lyase acyl carrier protein [Firmicutes bacterium]|nr:citrate lyase acyl carrier protein [Bacillota bacterium]
MTIRHKATAGTMQSSDAMITVEPSDSLEILIESTVRKQFEPLIREQVEATLARLGVTTGRIHISDRGALDYALSARVETAIQRAHQE